MDLHSVGDREAAVPPLRRTGGAADEVVDLIAVHLRLITQPNLPHAASEFGHGLMQDRRQVLRQGIGV